MKKKFNLEKMNFCKRLQIIQKLIVMYLKELKQIELSMKKLKKNFLKYLELIFKKIS